MKRGATILALALVTAATANAQGPARAPAQGPAQRLLAHRAELSLTAEQVQKLEAIDRKYASQDRESIAKLEALRGQPIGQPLRMRDLPAADREQLLANRAQLQPVREQLRGSHQAAVEEVRGVLNAEQNGKAGQYLFQGPGQGQGRGPVAAMRGQGQGPGRGFGPGRASMHGRGQMQGGGGGMMQSGGRGMMQGGGRSMMRHAPGTGQGFRGGRGGWAAR